MRIHIATDHAGLELSHFLIRELTKQGHEVFDHRPSSYDPLDDYPSFCINAALAVVADQQAGVEALSLIHI
jgi:ribose 5-phosphate isomerase B